MIPYLAQPVWTLGPFTVHAFGVAVCISLLLSYGLVLRRPGKYGVTSTAAGRMFVVMVVAGLAAGYMWAQTFSEQRGVSDSGLSAGAALKLFAFAWRNRSWTLLDLFGSVFPIAVAIARVGCFFAHDHIGRATSSWVGVQFPTGTRFDLGLLYALAAVATGLVVEWISRTKAPAGVLFGVMAALFVLTRILILGLGSSAGLADVLFGLLGITLGCGISILRLTGYLPLAHAALK